MTNTKLKEKAMTYFTVLDTENMKSVINYMESLDVNKQKKKLSLSDLKGKIRFSDGYDYKSMRM